MEQCIAMHHLFLLTSSVSTVSFRAPCLKLVVGLALGDWSWTSAVIATQHAHRVTLFCSIRHAKVEAGLSGQQKLHKATFRTLTVQGGGRTCLVGVLSIQACPRSQVPPFAESTAHGAPSTCSTGALQETTFALQPPTGCVASPASLSPPHDLEEEGGCICLRNTGHVLPCPNEIVAWSADRLTQLKRVEKLDNDIVPHITQQG